MKFSTAVALSLVLASVEGLQLSMSSSYLKTMTGARGTALSPKSYAPSGGKPKVVVNNMGSSYLNNVNRSPSPSYTSSNSRSAVSAPVVSSPEPLPASYLTNLSGASSSAVSSPRGKFSAFSGRKPKVVVSNMGSSYLNQVGGVSPVVSSSSAPASGSYLSNLGGGSTSVGSANRGSFSAFSGKKPKVVVYNMGSSYLNKLKESVPAQASSLELGNLGGASVASIPRGRFSAFTGKKPKVVVNNMGSSYLNGIRSGSSTSAFSVDSASVAPGSSVSAPRGSYSTFAEKKPKSVVNNMGSSYLNNVGHATASLSFSVPVSAAPRAAVNLVGSSSVRGSYSPAGKKPKSVVNNMGSSYLNTVNSGSALSSFAGHSTLAVDSFDSFANWEPAPAPVKSWSPYKPLTKSYSLAGKARAPAVVEAPTVAAGSYLESLRGGRSW